MATGNSLYQLEVKLPSEDGITRTQVIRLKGTEQLWYSTRDDFPEQGNNEMLYVATDEKKIYIWFENDYLALSGYADDVLSQLDELKAELVGYETHTHNFVAKGKIVGNAIGNITYSTATVNSMINAGQMPIFDSEYNGDTLSLLWTPGVLPEAEAIEVVKGIEYTLAKLTFEGEETESGQPNIFGASLVGTWLLNESLGYVDNSFSSSTFNNVYTYFYDSDSGFTYDNLVIVYLYSNYFRTRKGKLWNDFYNDEGSYSLSGNYVYFNSDNFFDKSSANGIKLRTLVVNENYSCPDKFATWLVDNATKISDDTTI